MSSLVPLIDWGLRDYGTATWEGGLESCEHNPQKPDGGERADRTVPLGRGGLYRTTCLKCGARRIDAQLGLETTPEEFVAKMVEVFREVKRVLRADGTCWVNLGDSYAGSANSGGDSPRGGGGVPYRVEGLTSKIAPGLKPKDLCGIPWRVAFALQADGWWLRSEIIWSKPNPMPESVTDRPTKAHETVFLLTKAARYYYDAEAVREDITGNAHSRGSGDYEKGGSPWHEHPREPVAGRNKRTVWTIPTQAFSQAHFATFPEKLVEPCILAGTSERGCCPECGSPWRRSGCTPQSILAAALCAARESVGLSRAELAVAVGKGENNIWDWEVGGHLPRGGAWDKLMAVLGLAYSRSEFIEQAEYIVTGSQAGPKQQGASGDSFVNRPYAERKLRIPSKTTGWEAGCSCGHTDTRPCVCLDPFAGSGTVGAVAVRLGRHAVLIELSEEYCKLAVEARLSKALAQLPLL